MSFVFLGAVVVNGQFKKSINTQKGRMGERMLRRLRYELYDRILRFPPAHFRKVKQAEIATMIKDEVEPLGGFIGDAFVQPMFLGGQALTAIIFILMQNWLLGIIVVVLLAVQMAIIPRLRKPVLVLGRERQITARQLAGRIAETRRRRDTRSTSTAPPTTSAPTSPSGWAASSGSASSSTSKKFVAKFWNNFLSQVTPFLFYLVGGYFAITGQMDVGALVGVLRGLQGPALADQGADRLGPAAPGRADQVRAGGRAVPARGHDAPAELQAIPDGPPPPLGARAGAGRRHGLRGRPGEAARRRVARSLPTDAQARGDRRLGLGQGRAGPGAGAAGAAQRRLDQDRRQGLLPAARVRAGRAHRLRRPGDLSVPAVGARQPAVRPEASGRSRRPRTTTRRRPVREAFWKEAERAGNPALDPNADWIDYELAGATGPADLLPLHGRMR